jgi:uncharacterized membrane protein YphA (DoxX/SURF4 family)
MSDARQPGLLARLFLTPLRLATGWGRTPRVLGTGGVLAIIFLRLCIGFHFYSEGVDKLSANFDAGLFFQNARGPFASVFYKQVWDWDGSIRLDTERTERFWNRYARQIANHYDFDADQRKQVDAAVERAETQLAWVMKSNADTIEEFELGRQRIAQLERDDARDGVASLSGQRDTIRREWKQLISPVLVQIDQIWTNLETEANDLANPQQESRGYFRLGKPRDVIVDTSVINPIIPYFDLTLGVCLLLGLFTPLVALIAAGFLGSVFMSQYPPVTGPGSTYYHMTEAAGCLVLAATGAGRFAGLDFILYAIFARLWPASSEH